ncbi:MAG: nucleotide exchange factor GrpE [Spirochaetaceae bacterium]|jgi:molecular chaperone GrpE|nr:nucleotide exchange factor GrpE [Spirochaetaceae bacterium]
MSEDNRENLNKMPGSDAEASASGCEFDDAGAENSTLPGAVAGKAADSGGAGGQGSAKDAFGDESEESDPRQRVEDLERKLAELNDQYLRKVADFENFRKRIVKEKQEAIEFANQSLLLDLIATLDNFDRAISVAGSSAKTEADFDAFLDGISMIEKGLLGQLENKWGLKRFDSTGAPFDPIRHEAVLMEKSAGVDEPVVQEAFAKGYMLKDRVVRTAKVKVLMPEKEN